MRVVVRNVCGCAACMTSHRPPQGGQLYKNIPEERCLPPAQLGCEAVYTHPLEELQKKIHLGSTLRDS